MTDTLPSFVDFVQGSVQVDGSTGHYGLEDGALTVELGNIAPGAAKKVTFQVTVNESAYNQTFQNTAVLGADNSDPVVPSDKGVTVEDGSTEMSAVKSVDKDTAKVGEALTYTVKVSNGKGATVALRDAVMTDTIPDGLDFTHGSVQVDGTTAKYTYDSTAKKLTVELGEITPEQNKTVTFEAVINASAYAETLKNTAVISAENSEDVTATTEAGTTVDDGKARMSAAKSVDKAKANVGDTLTYTITSSNAETATVSLKNVVMTDTLPEYVTFNQGSVAVDGNAAHKTGTDPGVTVPSPTPEPTPVPTPVPTPDQPDKPSNPTPTPDNPNTPTPSDQQPTGTKTVDKTIVKPRETVTYTITATNTTDKVWSSAQATDTLDNSIMTLINDSITINGTKATSDQWSFGERDLAINLGDIQPGSSVKAEFCVEFKTDASSKTFTNHATLKSPSHKDVDLTAPEVSITQDVTIPFTDIHYALYHGYGDSDGNPTFKWGPEDPITLTQVCHIAVRIMTDDYRKSLGSGTKTVPDAVKSADARFLISLGMVTPAEYPSEAEGKKPATQAQTYRILGSAFKRDFTSYIAKADGQVSRIKLAMDLCDFTDRDTNPNRNGLAGRTFTDVGSYAALVAEVSNGHEYTKDSSGRETWIKIIDE